MADLTCYRLRRAPNGPVADFDDAIDDDDLDLLEVGEQTTIGGVRAKLFLAPARPHQPSGLVCSKLPSAVASISHPFREPARS
jgi:hypothetical protein